MNRNHSETSWALILALVPQFQMRGWTFAEAIDRAEALLERFNGRVDDGVSDELHALLVETFTELR